MISKLPEGWLAVPLSEIAHEVQERNPNEPDIPVLSVTKYDGFVLSLEYFKKQIFSKDTSNYKLVRKGQFAYATIHLDEGSIDVLDKFDCGLISPMYTVFEPDSKKIDLNYLRYQMKSGRFIQMYAHLGQGSINRRKSISFKTLGTLRIPLPPITEQQKITAILSSVDEALASTQAVIDQTRKVKQGLLQQLLTRGIGHTKFKESAIGEIPEQWKCVQIGNSSQIIDPNPSHRYPPPQETGIPLVSTANFIGEDGYDFSNCQYVSQETFEEQNRRCDFRYDDIIFARKGRIGLARQYGDVAKCFSHTLVSIKVNAALANSEYLLWVVRSPLFLGQIDQTMNSNSGVPTLGVKTISETLIPLPSLEEQEHIAYLLSSLHESITRNQDKIAQLTVLKRALMQELLTGRIRVKYPLPK